MFRWALLLAALGAIGCGPKPPQKNISQPLAFLPEAGACPDLIAGDNVQMSTSIVESNAPIIAPTGDTFVVAWNDLHGTSSDVFMVRIDKKGAVQGAARKLANQGKARNRTLTSNGDDAVLVWSDLNGVKSARFGAPDEKPKTLSQNGVAPASGPWGAVAWVENGTLLFLSKGMEPVSRKGSNRLIPAKITSGSMERIRLAYNGSYYVLVWSTPTPSGRQIRLQRISPTGKKLGAEVHVSSLVGISQNPVVVWDGSNFVIAWTHATPSNQHASTDYLVFIAVVPNEGDAPLWTRRMQFVSSDDEIGLTATGKEIALVWVSQLDAISTSVFLQRLNSTGNQIGTIIEVTDQAPTTCGSPKLAWIGDGYGIVWHDDRTQIGTEVYFAFVGCAPTVDAGF
jgi:hypothetical protein